MHNDSSIAQAYFGLSDLIIWVRANWLLILAPAVVCVILGIAYSLVATPKYEVETLLAPQDQTSSNQVLNQLGSQFGALGLGGIIGQDRGNQADVSIAVLQSRQFLVEFIKRHNLLPKLFASRWDTESEAWSDDGDPPPTTNDGFRKLTQGILFVDRDEVTGFLTVSIEWKDPQVAFGWLVALIDDLNEGVRQREREEAVRTLQFLREELQRTDLVDLRQALNQLILIEMQELTLANVRKEFAFKYIDPPFLPDADDPVWPNYILILLGSTSLGLFLGFAIAVLVTAFRSAARNK